MLSKLIKQEYLYSRKILGWMNIAILAISLLVAIPLRIALAKTPTGDLVGGVDPFVLIFFFIVGTLLFAATSYTVSILCAYRYYQSMYGRESYLTHTLPASTDELVFSKVLVFYGWELVTMIAPLPAVLILLSTDDWYVPVHIAREIREATTLPVSVLVLSGVLICLLSLLVNIGMIVFSISVGSLFFNHKVLASVFAYVASYIILQIGSYPFMEAFNIDKISGDNWLWPIIGAILILLTLLNIVYFFFSWYIPRKHLNLN